MWSRLRTPVLLLLYYYFLTYPSIIIIIFFVLPLPYRNRKMKNRAFPNSKLHTKWSIWTHDKADEQFTDDSYKKCYIIHTWSDFWTFFNSINDYGKDVENHITFKNLYN